MISRSARTGFEHHSTVELDEFIEEHRKFTKPAFSFEESEFEKAVREKSKRTQAIENQAKMRSELHVDLLKNQQEILESILSEMARPWYKTANGWFSFIAMVAAIAGVVLVTLELL